MELPTALKERLESPEFARGYVAFMLGFMGRGIAASSRTDKVVMEEARGFPVGFTFEMRVLPAGPGLALRKTGEGYFCLLKEPPAKRPHLSIQFKHLRHAFHVLTFQESTAIAFANDRMIVDGDVAWAMRMVRILNRFQALTLPPAIAIKALKRVPQIPDDEKRSAALRIFSRLALDALVG